MMLSVSSLCRPRRLRVGLHLVLCQLRFRLRSRFRLRAHPFCSGHHVCLSRNGPTATDRHHSGRSYPGSDSRTPWHLEMDNASNNDDGQHSPLRTPRPVLKRTRHACDPCRRKKSKCSGERPSCATCARLRQRCTWPAEADEDINVNIDTGVSADDSSSSIVVVAHETPRRREESHGVRSSVGQQQNHLESRLHSLESTISHVLDTLHSVSAAGALHSLSSEVLHPASPQDGVGLSSPSSRAATKRPAAGPSGRDTPRDSPRKRARHVDEGDVPVWKQAEAVAGHYLKYCEGQPLYLFHRETFVTSLRFRPDELLLAILAVTLRFKDANEGPATTQSGGDGSTAEAERYNAKGSLTLAAKAHALVMAKIGTRAIELSTLQTLCLLAFVHFHGE